MRTSPSDDEQPLDDDARELGPSGRQPGCRGRPGAALRARGAHRARRARLRRALRPAPLGINRACVFYDQRNDRQVRAPFIRMSCFRALALRHWSPIARHLRKSPESNDRRGRPSTELMCWLQGANTWTECGFAGPAPGRKEGRFPIPWGRHTQTSGNPCADRRR